MNTNGRTADGCGLDEDEAECLLETYRYKLGVRSRNGKYRTLRIGKRT
jgi:hypothetical protein